MSTTNKDLRDYCHSVYTQTRNKWASLRGQYPTWECRFSILYGPPALRPELLILGTNPGFDPSDLYDAEIESWPKANEYWVKDWPLAVRLRALFREAGCTESLREAVGANLLFFKSKSLKPHPSGLGWKDNPPHIRHTLERFCSEQLRGLVREINPKRILTLGFQPFDNITDSVMQVTHSATDKDRKRRIFAVGTGWDRKVFGIIHPTGARVSTQDCKVIAQQLSSCLRD